MSVPLLDTHIAGPLLPACWLHLPQLSSAMLSSIHLLGLSCFKIHQARSCRDLHLAVSSAMPFCITGRDYCRKSRAISPGTQSVELRISVQTPIAGDSHHKAWQRLLLAIRPTCPRRVLGMEDGYTKAGPREGSHAGDSLPALNTNTEMNRKTNELQEEK